MNHIMIHQFINHENVKFLVYELCIYEDIKLSFSVLIIDRMVNGMS